MKQPIDLAKRFATLADQDIKAFEVLLVNPEVADSQVGFHAQQAVEKCLKSVLAVHEIEFRKTHDLDELINLLELNSLELPPFVDQLDDLTPYAVAFRYDLFETLELDRERVLILVQSVRAWCEAHLG